MDLKKTLTKSCFVLNLPVQQKRHMDDYYIFVLRLPMDGRGDYQYTTTSFCTFNLLLKFSIIIFYGIIGINFYELWWRLSVFKQDIFYFITWFACLRFRKVFNNSVRNIKASLFQYLWWFHNCSLVYLFSVSSCSSGI